MKFILYDDIYNILITFFACPCQSIFFFHGGWQTAASAINSEKACLKMTLTRLDSECPFERSQKNVTFQTFLIVGLLVSKPWKIALFYTNTKRLADCNCIQIVSKQTNIHKMALLVSKFISHSSNILVLR